MRELKKRIGLVEVMKSGKGFTLVETLVAITIIMLAVAGPLYTASRAIVAAGIARDQLTASYLAQEGIEYVRMMRDTHYLAAYITNSAAASVNGWYNFLHNPAVINPPGISACRFKDNHFCTLDPDPSSSVYGLNQCPGGVCAPLHLSSSGFYSQEGSITTSFTRSITEKDVSTTVTSRGDPIEIQVVSTVTWSSHGVPYTITVTDHLTPWQ